MKSNLVFNVQFVLYNRLHRLKILISLRFSPSPDTAGLAAGEATLFRLAGLSAEPESMLEEGGKYLNFTFHPQRKQYK